MSRWVDAGALDEMEFDPGYPVRVEGRWLAVFPSGGGYRVIDNACPHASAPLCDGTLLNGKVVCHLHLWEFDLETGACDAGADWAVQTYEARAVDGRLQVALPDAD
ncbi:MAG: Rieske 2Fe-2S domain-containing protein [Planctomycetota bacterium]|nr:Rieske 2Fe-2S domain-containing protein [Planctomycetota bacterium]MEC8651311.1 Rieske 2Fe-2S domain-containing protein [Planctomycetota bacterium]MEC9046608.1 Rieske 2Fe-2S domain-containing protein [Planctomycetota bacterium]